MGIEVCKNCKETKELSQFTKDCSKKTGYKTICKTCDTNRAKKYYKENKNEISWRRKQKRKNDPNVQKKQKNYYDKNRVRILSNQKIYRNSNKEKFAEYDKKYRHNYPKRTLLTHAKKRAKKYNLPINITENDFEIPKLCPIFNKPLVIGDKKPDKYSITLDRIIPENGYVKNNIVVISYRANTIKNNASLEELKLLKTNLRKIIELDSFSWMEKIKILKLETQTISKNNLYYLLRASKTRAANKTLDWNIDYKDIIVPKYCPLLEIPITKNFGKLKSNSITIDRIFPKNGYVTNNISIISHKANTVKNNASLMEIEMIYKFYKNLVI